MYIDVGALNNQLARSRVKRAFDCSFACVLYVSRPPPPPLFDSADSDKKKNGFFFLFLCCIFLHSISLSLSFFLSRYNEIHDFKIQDSELFCSADSNNAAGESTADGTRGGYRETRCCLLRKYDGVF